MAEPLGILLISGGHERAHYAFMLAAGAAALGRKVVVMATNEGCRALLQDWSGMADSGRDQEVKARGVAGLDELREAVAALGAQFLVCDAGLLLMGGAPEPLLAGVEVSGIPAFLSAVGAGQIVTL